MRIRDEKEDAMLDSSAKIKVWFLRIGSGTDPKWLQIRADRDAKLMEEMLQGINGFKGVVPLWPGNLAAFKYLSGAEAAREKLKSLKIPCGEIIPGEALPDLKQIWIKPRNGGKA